MPKPIRLKILVASASIAVLAVVGTTVGVVAAQSEEDGSSSTFAERVASILGVSTSEVESAFDQAKDAIRDEATASKLAALVAAGTITQEDSDAITAWLEDRPEIAIDSSVHSGKFGRWGRGIGGLGHGPFGFDSSGDRLASLVEKGTISQEDAESLTEWYDDAPEVVSELGGSHGSSKFSHRRGHRFGGFKSRGDRFGWSSQQSGSTTTESTLDPASYSN